jgi:polar amino acid transport system substrate-binding protein
LYLTRTLRSATLVRAEGFEGSLALFTEGRTDALAALKPALLDMIEQLPQARLLDGRFMTINHGLATPRDRTAAAAWLAQFVQEMRASGFIARSIERHQVKGLAALR